ncbi:ATP-dependent DNA helicase RRM3-like [Asparagus officinalis]|uniref:ATP-dependent DNA helicase RRM3-like n=1 Tax=Asparagus officinalis TaxID=4686 RepID=UPI00098E68F0|nr:ATP-dependent DNA helicase RRM3-like [Asparagus officinalis]
MEANKCYPEARDLTYAEFSAKFVWKKKEKCWKPRKKGQSVGRIVYAHPSCGERFYLRLLLNVVKGPTSFDDIREFNGTVYQTYNETCAAMRLLDDDNEWKHAIDEASYSSSGRQMRQLFAQILIFGEVVDPKKLWNDNWKCLTEGFIELQRKLLNMATLDMTDTQLQNHALSEIQDLLLQNGQSLLNFSGMPTPDPQLLKQSNDKLISQELNFNREELRKEHEIYFQGLNTQQRDVYNAVIDSVYSRSGGLYFLYGHGGTGKTYVWKSICTKLRSEGKIVLPVASSGIALILLPYGRTAHSRFKIPIILNEHSTCGIKQGSPEANLIKQTDLIIWDEAPMMHRFAFETVDRTLRDIVGKDNPMLAEKPFGGITVVLGGDFRQILPVVPRGSKHDIIHATLSRSKLWNYFKNFKLTQNMRIQQQSSDQLGMNASEFSEWVLEVGNGTLSFNDCEKEESKIAIPRQLLLQPTRDAIEDIIASTYPDIQRNCYNQSYLEERAILTSRNEIVDKK